MRARAASSILAACLAPALAAAIAAQSPSAPPLGTRLDPSPAFAEAARAPEPLDAESFARLAVRASLVEPGDGSFPSEAEGAVARLLGFVDREAKALSALESPYERGAAALAALHRSLLRRYVLEQARVDLAMDSGDYNCVSSAVLYMALAKAAGLETHGVATADHAFAMVRTERGWIDVETTNPIGYDPGTHKEVFTDSFGRVTGYAYVPPGQYAKRNDLGDKAMIGLILHDRVSLLESQGEFADSLALAADRRALEGEAMGEFLRLRAANLASSLINGGENEKALAFLDAYQARYPGDPMVAQARNVAVRNRLAELSSAGRYEEGYAFVQRAREAWGDEPVFAEFDAAAVKNRAIDLLRSGSYRAALDFLDKSEAAGRGNPKDLPSLRENAALGLINLSLKSGSLAESLSLVDEFTRKGFLSEGKRREALKSSAGAEANRRARADPESGWLSASLAYDAALAYLPGDADLLRNRQACLDNYATSVYNRFVSAYNSGKRADALRILKEGLSKYPDSPLLKKNLAQAEASGS